MSKSLIRSGDVVREIAYVGRRPLPYAKILVPQLPKWTNIANVFNFFSRFGPIHSIVMVSQDGLRKVKLVHHCISPLPIVPALPPQLAPTNTQLDQASLLQRSASYALVNFFYLTSALEAVTVAPKCTWPDGVTSITATLSYRSVVDYLLSHARSSARLLEDEICAYERAKAYLEETTTEASRLLPAKSLAHLNATIPPLLSTGASQLPFDHTSVLTLDAVYYGDGALLAQMLRSSAEATGEHTRPRVGRSAARRALYAKAPTILALSDALAQRVQGGGFATWSVWPTEAVQTHIDAAYLDADVMDDEACAASGSAGDNHDISQHPVGLRALEGVCRGEVAITALLRNPGASATESKATDASVSTRADASGGDGLASLCEYPGAHALLGGDGCAAQLSALAGPGRWRVEVLCTDMLPEDMSAVALVRNVSATERDYRDELPRSRAFLSDARSGTDVFSRFGGYGADCVEGVREVCSAAGTWVDVCVGKSVCVDVRVLGALGVTGVEQPRPAAADTCDVVVHDVGACRSDARCPCLACEVERDAGVRLGGLIDPMSDTHDHSLMALDARTRRPCSVGVELQDVASTAANNSRERVRRAVALLRTELQGMTEGLREHIAHMQAWDAARRRANWLAQQRADAELAERRAAAQATTTTKPYIGVATKTEERGHARTQLMQFARRGDWSGAVGEGQEADEVEDGFDADTATPLGEGREGALASAFANGLDAPDPVTGDETHETKTLSLQQALDALPALPPSDQYRARRPRPVAWGARAVSAAVEWVRVQVCADAQELETCEHDDEEEDEVACVDSTPSAMGDANTCGRDVCAEASAVGEPRDNKSTCAVVNIQSHAGCSAAVSSSLLDDLCPCMATTDVCSADSRACPRGAEVLSCYDEASPGNGRVVVLPFVVTRATRIEAASRGKPVAPTLPSSTTAKDGIPRAGFAAQAPLPPPPTIVTVSAEAGVERLAAAREQGDSASTADSAAALLEALSVCVRSNGADAEADGDIIDYSEADTAETDAADVEQAVLAQVVPCTTDLGMAAVTEEHDSAVDSDDMFALAEDPSEAVALAVNEQGQMTSDSYRLSARTSDTHRGVAPRVDAGKNKVTSAIATEEDKDDLFALLDMVDVHKLVQGQSHSQSCSRSHNQSQGINAKPCREGTAANHVDDDVADAVDDGDTLLTSTPGTHGDVTGGDVTDDVGSARFCVAADDADDDDDDMFSLALTQMEGSEADTDVVDEGDAAAGPTVDTEDAIGLADAHETHIRGPSSFFGSPPSPSARTSPPRLPKAGSFSFTSSQASSQRPSRLPSRTYTHASLHSQSLTQAQLHAQSQLYAQSQTQSQSQEFRFPELLSLDTLHAAVSMSGLLSALAQVDSCALDVQLAVAPRGSAGDHADANRGRTRVPSVTESSTVDLSTHPRACMSLLPPHAPMASPRALLRIPLPAYHLLPQHVLPITDSAAVPPPITRALALAAATVAAHPACIALPQALLMLATLPFLPRHSAYAALAADAHPLPLAPLTASLLPLLTAITPPPSSSGWPAPAPRLPAALRIAVVPNGTRQAQPDPVPTIAGNIATTSAPVPPSWLLARRHELDLDEGVAHADAHAVLAAAEVAQTTPQRFLLPRSSAEVEPVALLTWAAGGAAPAAASTVPVAGASLASVGVSAPALQWSVATEALRGGRVTSVTVVCAIDASIPTTVCDDTLAPTATSSFPAPAPQARASALVLARRRAAIARWLHPHEEGMDAGTASASSQAPAPQSSVVVARALSWLAPLTLLCPALAPTPLHPQTILAPVPDTHSSSSSTCAATSSFAREVSHTSLLSTLPVGLPPFLEAMLFVPTAAWAPVPCLLPRAAARHAPLPTLSHAPNHSRAAAFSAFAHPSGAHDMWRAVSCSPSPPPRSLGPLLPTAMLSPTGLLRALLFAAHDAYLSAARTLLSRVAEGLLAPQPSAAASSWPNTIESTTAPVAAPCSRCVATALAAALPSLAHLPAPLLSVLALSHLTHAYAYPHAHTHVPATVSAVSAVPLLPPPAARYTQLAGPLLAPLPQSTPVSAPDGVAVAGPALASPSTSLTLRPPAIPHAHIALSPASPYAAHRAACPSPLHGLLRLLAPPSLLPLLPPAATAASTPATLPHLAHALTDAWWTRRAPVLLQHRARLAAAARCTVLPAGNTMSAPRPARAGGPNPHKAASTASPALPDALAVAADRALLFSLVSGAPAATLTTQTGDTLPRAAPVESRVCVSLPLQPAIGDPALPLPMLALLSQLDASALLEPSFPLQHLLLALLALLPAPLTPSIMALYQLEVAAPVLRCVFSVAHAHTTVTVPSLQPHTRTVAGASAPDMQLDVQLPLPSSSPSSVLPSHAAAASLVLPPPVAPLILHLLAVLLAHHLLLPALARALAPSLAAAPASCAVCPVHSVDTPLSTPIPSPAPVLTLTVPVTAPARAPLPATLASFAQHAIALVRAAAPRAYSKVAHPFAPSSHTHMHTHSHTRAAGAVERENCDLKPPQPAAPLAGAALPTTSSHASSTHVPGAVTASTQHTPLPFPRALAPRAHTLFAVATAAGTSSSPPSTPLPRDHTLTVLLSGGASPPLHPDALALSTAADTTTAPGPASAPTLLSPWLPAAFTPAPSLSRAPHPSHTHARASDTDMAATSSPFASSSYVHVFPAPSSTSSQSHSLRARALHTPYDATLARALTQVPSPAWLQPTHLHARDTHATPLPSSAPRGSPLSPSRAARGQHPAVLAAHAQGTQTEACGSVCSLGVASPWDTPLDAQTYAHTSASPPVPVFSEDFSDSASGDPASAFSMDFACAPSARAVLTPSAARTIGAVRLPKHASAARVAPVDAPAFGPVWVPTLHTSGTFPLRQWPFSRDPASAAHHHVKEDGRSSEGQLPPEPASLRGRVGVSAVNGGGRGRDETGDEDGEWEDFSDDSADEDMTEEAVLRRVARTLANANTSRVRAAAPGDSSTEAPRGNVWKRRRGAQSSAGKPVRLEETATSSDAHTSVTTADATDAASHWQLPRVPAPTAALSLVFAHTRAQLLAAPLILRTCVRVTVLPSALPVGNPLMYVVHAQSQAGQASPEPLYGPCAACVDACVAAAGLPALPLPPSVDGMSATTTVLRGLPALAVTGAGTAVYLPFAHCLAFARLNALILAMQQQAWLAHAHARAACTEALVRVCMVAEAAVVAAAAIATQSVEARVTSDAQASSSLATGHSMGTRPVATMLLRVSVAATSTLASLLSLSLNQPTSASMTAECTLKDMSSGDIASMLLLVLQPLARVLGLAVHTDLSSPTTANGAAWADAFVEKVKTAAMDVPNASSNASDVPVPRARLLSLVAALPHMGPPSPSPMHSLYNTAQVVTAVPRNLQRMAAAANAPVSPQLLAYARPLVQWATALQQRARECVTVANLARAVAHCAGDAVVSLLAVCEGVDLPDAHMRDPATASAVACVRESVEASSLTASLLGPLLRQLASGIPTTNSLPQPLPSSGLAATHPLAASKGSALATTLALADACTQRHTATTPSHATTAIAEAVAFCRAHAYFADTHPLTPAPTRAAPAPRRSPPPPTPAYPHTLLADGADIMKHLRRLAHSQAVAAAASQVAVQRWSVPCAHKHGPSKKLYERAQPATVPLGMPYGVPASTGEKRQVVQWPVPVRPVLLGGSRVVDANQL